MKADLEVPQHDGPAGRAELVSVVITTRNRAADVLACVASLLRSSYPCVEAIIVDNNSRDDTVERVRSAYPQVQVLASTRNLGLVGGRNAGQQASRGEYVFFLDDDTEVDPECISAMVDVMRSHPRCGIVGPKIYYFEEPDRLWFAGATLNLRTSRAHNVGVLEWDKGQYNETVPVSHVPTGFLARRAMLEQIEGHDPLFVQSFGDADFAFRARKAGWDALLAPKAKLWHKVSAATVYGLRGLGFVTPQRAYYYGRNRLIFMKRHAGLPNLLLFMCAYYPVILSYYSLRIVRQGGWPAYFNMFWRGTLDGLIYLLMGQRRGLSAKEQG